MCVCVRVRACVRVWQKHSQWHGFIYSLYCTLFTCFSENGFSSYHTRSSTQCTACSSMQVKTTTRCGLTRHHQWIPIICSISSSLADLLPWYVLRLISCGVIVNHTVQAIPKVNIFGGGEVGLTMEQVTTTMPLLCVRLLPTTSTTVLWPFIQDYLGEPVPKETFPHSHQCWSSIILYLLPLFTTIHSILPVQFTCLTVFLHNLSPSPLWSTSLSGTVHFILRTFLHPIIVFFSQHMPIPLQSVLL